MSSRPRTSSLLIMVFSLVFQLFAQITPFSANGRLKVTGTNLCSSAGTPIQLRGMSTHGIQWFGWGDCVTASSIEALATIWGADILRISLYVQEGGYATDPAGFTADVNTIIEAASSHGMYCLIDWHQLTPGDPWENITLATQYFTAMSAQHAGRGNILYEICNEPNGDVSWADIKSYAETLIPVIRANDPDGIIIVGTPHWSSLGLSSGSNPWEVINNRLTGTNAYNVMYSFHFYAASHGDYYVDAVREAADHIPIFVTEWGTQDAAGEGSNDLVMSQKYIDMMAEKKISWCNWNYSDDWRSGAVFQPGTCPHGPWTGSSLKEAGTWVQQRIQIPHDSWLEQGSVIAPVSRAATRLWSVAMGPNPFRADLRISIAGTRAECRISVYNHSGSLVRQLSPDGTGAVTVTWDGRDSSGEKCAPGIYVVSIDNGREHRSQAVSLMR